MQQYPAYLCGLRLEVLLARLVSLVSTSHFCACVCVWKLVMSSTREYSTVKRILGIKRGPVMLYVCVCVSGVKKDFVDNKGDDERQKVETDLIYCFFLPSRKKGLATKPPRTFRLCGIRRSSPKPGLPLTLPAHFSSSFRDIRAMATLM